MRHGYSRAKRLGLVAGRRSCLPPSSGRWAGGWPHVPTGSEPEQRPYSFGGVQDYDEAGRRASSRDYVGWHGVLFVLLDEKAATTSTQVVAYLNACLEQPSLNDEGMLDVSSSLARLRLPPVAASVVRRTFFAEPFPGRSSAIALRQTKNPSAMHLKASPLVQAGLRRIGRWQTSLLIFKPT